MIHLLKFRFLIHSLIQHITEQVNATSHAEWLAFLFGLAQVLLALKNKSINFYAGIISVIFYIYVFYTAGLFAESLLNAYYLVISIAGIFSWQGKTPLPISRNTNQDWLLCLMIAICSWGFLYLILRNFTTSTVPLLDSLVSATAWAGTWLLMKRKVENWLVLNVSNAIAIPLLLIKQLELTALLTCIYFVVAVFGYLEWKKTMRGLHGR